MKYDDLFEKPLIEYTDEQIIARALELREKTKVAKKAGGAAKKKSTPATTKTKAESAMEALIAQAAKNK